MPKARGLAAIACALVVATGCARPGASTPLRIAVRSDVVAVDPHRQNDLATQGILANIYEGLVSFDAEMRVRPALAERWESPDDLTWRFRLREASFHDGRKLSAEDVVFSLRRAAHDANSKVSGYLATMREVRAVDEHQVEVTTVRPLPILLNKLAVVAIVPRGSPPEIREPVGTGPYRVARHVPGENLELRAYEGYWGGVAAERDVRFLFVPDEARRTALLLQGQADLVSGLAADEVERVRSAPGCRVTSRPSLVVFNLGARVDRAPLSDVRLRRAVHLALDRAALVESVLHRRGAPAGQFVSPAVFGYAPEIRPPARDLAAARRLLAEAGFPRGVDLTLEHTPNLAPHAAAIADQLSEAGIRVKAVAWPWEALYQRLFAGESAFFLLGFACDTGDATDVMDIVLHSRDPGAGYGAHNFSGYVNTSFDLMLGRSGEAMGVVARLGLLRDAMRIAVEDLPLVPLWTPETAYGFREELVWQPRVDQKLHAYAMRREARGGRP